MKRLAIMITLVLLHTSGAQAQRLPIDLSPLFSDVYENPVAEAYEAGIPGLIVCYVVDEEQIDDDPLFPDCWLVTDETHEHRCDLEGFQEALSVLDFVPSTEEEVLAVTGRLTGLAFHEQVLSESISISSWNVSDDVAALIASPVVTQADGVFTVAYYTSYTHDGWIWADQMTRIALRFRTIEIGPGTLTMPTYQELWSETYGASDPARIPVY